MMIIMVVEVIMMISRIKISSFSNIRFWLNGIVCTLPGRELTSAGSEVQEGVGWVGRGFDGRQTCGAEAVIMVQMVFREGEVSV